MEIKRHYFKWNINEIIKLQREYELLELSIQEIAKLHSRSVRAILCKLQQEDFIKHWEDTKGYKEYMDSQEDLDDESDSDYGSEENTDNESLSDTDTDSYADSEFDTLFSQKDISKEVSKDFEKLNKIQLSMSYLSNLIKNLFDTNNKPTLVSV
jgi:hypothetical protein